MGEVHGGEIWHGFFTVGSVAWLFHGGAGGVGIHQRGLFFLVNGGGGGHAAFRLSDIHNPPPYVKHITPKSSLMNRHTDKSRFGQSRSGGNVAKPFV